MYKPNQEREGQIFGDNLPPTHRLGGPFSYKNSRQYVDYLNKFFFRLEFH